MNNKVRTVIRKGARLLGSGGFAFLALMPAHRVALAQSPAGPSEPSESTEPPGVEDAAELGVLVVTTKQSKSAILPTETDAFGLGVGLLETPRSVSTVSLAMIDQYSLVTVRDLIAVTPGVFTASFYGVDGTVNIRGEYADNYFRGFKRIENQGTYVTPIESALNLEVVRGIASPAYGTGRAGGYVNFNPRSDRARSFRNGLGSQGEVSAAGGTYDYYRATGEYGAPFTIGGYKAGIDAYVEKTQASQYFHGIEPEHVLGQFGVASDLPGQWQLDAGLQYYDASGMQGSTGINRLTQDLIDHGNYISGSPVAQIAADGADYITPADIDAIGGVTQYYGAVTDYSRLDPDTIQTVHLDRRTLLTSDYDFGDSKTVTAYLDFSRMFGAGILKFQGFYDALDADSYNSYGFAKSLDNNVQEFRLSYGGSALPTSWISANYIAGAGYRRYEADEGYAFARGYLVLDRQDITVGATPDSILNPLYVSGEPFDQLYHSTVDGYGAFFNTDLALGNHLKFTGGVRYDDYDVESSNTGLLDYSVPLNTVYKGSEGATSWSASLSVVTPLGIVPYVTRGKSYALETSQGGAVTPGNVSAGTFLSPTTLTEAGIKGSFFEDRLFVALSAYRQKRTQSELLSGNFVGARTEGLEAELRWAINRRFGLSAVATRQKTEIAGTSFLVVTPADFGIDYTDGWGYIYQAASSGFEGLEVGYTDRTQPRYVYGLFGNYEHGNGFGLTLGGNYVDETSGHLPGAIVFPDYFLLRGSAHYDVGRYRVALHINNILDERYYIPQRSTDTEGSAFPGEGRTAMLKFTVRL